MTDSPVATSYNPLLGDKNMLIRFLIKNKFLSILERRDNIYCILFLVWKYYDSNLNFFIQMSRQDIAKHIL